MSAPVVYKVVYDGDYDVVHVHRTSGKRTYFSPSTWLVDALLGFCLREAISFWPWIAGGSGFTASF